MKSHGSTATETRVSDGNPHGSAGPEIRNSAASPSTSTSSSRRRRFLCDHHRVFLLHPHFLLCNLLLLIRCINIFIFLFFCFSVFGLVYLNRIIFCSSYLLLNFLLLVWLDFFLCRLRMVFYHRILKFQSGMLSLFDKFLSSCHQLSSVESITWFLMLCLSLLHHRVLVRV